MIGRLVAASCCVLAMASACWAEPRVTQNVFYYDVPGVTASEVRANLMRFGPLGERGQRFDGHTRWFVRWHYRFREGEQGCDVPGITAIVDITIIMPRLAANAEIPPELARAFADYADKLMEHEKGHAENGIDVARRIEKAIAALPPKPSCDEFGDAANILGESLLDEAIERDRDYDRRTEHGRTQGAQFP